MCWTIYGNALQAASKEGHPEIVKLLLDKGADVNTQGGKLYLPGKTQESSAGKLHMTLQSRLRPAPGRHTPKSNPTTIISTALAPDFHDADDSSDIEESPEDLFSSFLAHLFPDDAPQFHGDPGQHLRYSSPRYGELEIMVPSWPGETKNEDAQTESEKKEGSHQAEEGRRLFAHHLWTAGMLVAEGVENADCKVRESESAAQKETRDIWSVQGETVLELGAGKCFESIQHE